jgi:hypothetical protein
VVGYYATADGVIHGFVRYGNNGRIRTFDAPGAVGPAGTKAIGINNQGTIVGRYVGADDNRHGFVLRNGVFTTFDVPGANNTILTAINERGDLTGYTFASVFDIFSGFVATRGGN